jgi:hypothetical protein
MQGTTWTPVNVGDTVGGYEKQGTVTGIVRTEPDGSQLLEIDYGRVGFFGAEIDTVWSHDLIQVEHPCWLIAVGDAEHVEVLRSPLVRDNDEWLQPISQFIADHGLVLAAQETVEDPDWMFGEVEMSVYVTAPADDAVAAA